MMRKLALTLLPLLLAGAWSHADAQGRRAPAAGKPTPTPSPTPSVASARALVKEGKDAEAEQQIRALLLWSVPGDETDKAATKVLQLIHARRLAPVVDAARGLIDQKKFDEAERNLTQALKGAPADSPEGKEAAALLTEARDLRRQYARLAQAQRLLDARDFAAASAAVKEVLDSAKDNGVIAEAARLQGVIHEKSRFAPRRLYAHYSATLWLILDILLAILLAILVLRLARRVYARLRRDKWVLFPIEDKTGLGVSEAVVESLGRWTDPSAPVSVGLLKLEMLQFASVPRLERQDQSFDVDLSQALAALPLQVGAVSLGGLAQGLAPLRRWFHAKRPWVKGSVFATDSQVTVRLTQRNAGGTTTTVSSSADKARGVEAAESASYKMYYLIANRASAEEAGAANHLRLGLNLLKQYVYSRSPEKLTEAYQAFRAARNESPAFDEAYLFEGIALDLLEQHDEAIKRFSFLARHTEDDALRKKARHNEAIARFRKYRPEEIQRAVDILDEVIGPEVSDQLLAASPDKALALATKANAIAHRPIFWQQLLFPGNPPSYDEDEIKERKRRKKTVIRGWVDEVEAIGARLTAVAAAVSPDNPAWDDLTRRQLSWAIQNGRGNAYLNYAKNILAPPVPEEVDNPALRTQDLEKAYAAFQDCEMILPPGVETLANLATVLSELGKESEARAYLQSAIALNKEYEYAHYRLAQSWEKQNNKEQVVRVLKDFAKIKSATIPSFRAIYSRYATELAQN